MRRVDIFQSKETFTDFGVVELQKISFIRMYLRAVRVQTKSQTVVGCNKITH